MKFRTPFIFGVVAGTLSIIPRILRLMHPTVQIEDPNYIYGAFLLLKGMIPFRDFAQPNPPLLESIIAAVYAQAGVNYRIPEIMTAAAYWMTSLLMYTLAVRFFNRWTALLASVVYSSHFLLCRYHLFEREVFATLAITAALVLLFSESESNRKDYLAGALMGIGFLCKQTALISFFPILAVLWIFQRKYVKGFRLLTGFAGCFALTTGFYLLLYGKDYLRQTFWFHFIKGSVGPWYIKAIWTISGLGFLSPVFLASLFALRLNRNDFRWVLWALAGADLVFFWFLTGAYWPHYLLSTLVPVSILSADTMVSLIQRSSVTRMEALVRVRIAFIALVAIGAIVLMNPRILTGEGAAHNWGFEGSNRATVQLCAETLRQNSEPMDIVVADPFTALLAERIIAVRFEDNWGLMQWMNAMLDEDKYFEELKLLQNSSFGDIRALSHMFWASDLLDAVMKKEIAAIMVSYEMPITREQLEGLNYRQVLHNDVCDLWVR